MKYRDTELCPVTFDLSKLLRTVAKSISFLMSVCLSACISEDPNGQIYVKCDIADFNKNQSRNSSFGKDRGNVPGNLQEGSV